MDQTVSPEPLATSENRGDSWNLNPMKPAERPLLDRMLQLYFYDFSEFDHDDLDESGRYSIQRYDRYGQETGYDAWILRVAGKPAGFALVDLNSPWPESQERHHIHEFHVLRAYRRRGLGQKMAHAIFDHYPGLWQIEQIGPNVDAQAFWQRVVANYTGGKFTERVIEGRRFPLFVQEFDTTDKVV